MTTFRYRGQTADGAKVSGIIRAFDEFEAVSELREKCAIITKIEPVRETADNIFTKPMNTGIKEKELAMLCSQFSILLSSGLTVLRCLQMVAGQSRNKQLRKALEKAAEEVSAGRSMADSLESSKDIKFPPTFIETVRAGEQSGSLQSCLARLKGYYDRSSAAKAKLASAMTYPIMVIITAIIVVIIVMVKAVPAFTSTFLELGTELPAITKGLIAMSDFFVKWWWVVIFAGAILGIGYMAYRRTENGRITLSKFALTKSPLRRLSSMSASGQFATALSAMLSSGLPVPKALTVAGEVAGNYMFTLASRKVRQDVERGRTMADSMKEIDYLPTMLTEMMGVGESSGTIVETLDAVGVYFVNETEIITNRMLALMEPIITIVLAVITMLLLLSVYLPMFSMYGAMGNL